MNIASTLQNYQLPTVESVKKGSARSQRDEVLEFITNRVNECRKEGGFQPFSYVAVATKLKKGGITPDRYWAFHRMCEAYNGPYTKAFFGALKPRKYTVPPR